MRSLRTGLWIAAAALVVLGGRAIAYALSPAPLAAMLQHRAGGPSLPVVAAASLALGFLVSSVVVWLAALGVRERRLLETRNVLDEPQLQLRRVAFGAVGLSAATCGAFALIESYVHWRAGMGWHGLHCLFGPVHRDAAPILIALSTVAAAVVTALEHVLAWMQRTITRLLASARCPRRRCTAVRRPPRLTLPPSRGLASSFRPRAPPLRI